MRVIRALAASCTLLLASFLGHILAGGNSLSLHSTLLIISLSVAIASILVSGREDPLKVVVAIFVAQNAGHFILGGQARSEWQMFFSHIVAGILSYQVLRYFEKNLPTLGTLVLALLPQFILVRLTFAPIRARNPLFSYRSLATPYFSLARSLRAPPLH